MRASERPGRGLALIINISARPPANLSFLVSNLPAGVGAMVCPVALIIIIIIIIIIIMYK